MKFKLLKFTFILLLSACNFDGQRRLDLQYPATLNLINNGESAIDVASIYNTDEIDKGFVLNGFRLDSGDQKSIRISYDVLSALQTKAVEFAGRCSDGEAWLLSGESLEYSKPSTTEIVYSISPCNSIP